MRRVIGDAVLTAGGAMALVLALVMFDDRVRDQITAVFDARHPTDAIARDKRQAAQVNVSVLNGIFADLVLAETTELALEEFGDRIPDLVLVPALHSPEEDGAVNAPLRVIAAAEDVPSVTMPVCAST